MVAVVAVFLAIIGTFLAVAGYVLYTTCGGLGLTFYGLSILAFGGAGGAVAGIRVLSVAVPFGLVILAGGLFFANAAGCL